MKLDWITESYGQWNFVTSTVLEMLEYYADQGDILTCLAVSWVLGDKLPLETMRVRQWVMSYIELLHRYQLWSLANTVISTCNDPEVRKLNLVSSVHTGCPKCKDPLIASGRICAKCKNLVNPCSICHQQVKGLYVWCQGCGHGGHLQHLNEWFNSNEKCPAGCSHRCSIRQMVS